MRDSFSPSIILAGIKAAWDEDDVDFFFEDLAKLGIDEDTMEEVSPGKFKIYPIALGDAWRIEKAMAGGPVNVEIQAGMTDTSTSIVTVFLTLVGYKGGPIFIEAGYVKRMIEDKAVREGITFEEAMNAMAKSGVKKQRAPQVDDLEKAPNPALMTQTPGVGTVTFDTSMGETMISSLKAAVEVRFTREEGGRTAQHYKEFATEEEAKAWVESTKKRNKIMQSAPFENFKIVPMGDTSKRYRVWWVVDKGGDDYNEFSSYPEGFATEAEAEAWAKKKRITRYEWGIKDTVEEGRQSRERKQDRSARDAEEAAKARETLKRLGLKSAAAPIGKLGKGDTLDDMVTMVQDALRNYGLKPEGFPEYLVRRGTTVYLWDEPIAVIDIDGQVTMNADNARRGFNKMQEEIALAPEAGGVFKASVTGAAEDIDISKSQLTQNARSVQVYRVAESMLEAGEIEGPVLDYGAGLGQSKQIFKNRELSQYEPHPREAVKKSNPKISESPSGAFGTVVCSFVLNVVPPEVRQDILGKIASLVKPGGHAVIGTRGSDVMDDVRRVLDAREKDPNAHPNVRIIDDATLVTSKGTYQHGFTKEELAQECQDGMAGFSVVKTAGGASYPIVVLKKG